MCLEGGGFSMFLFLMVIFYGVVRFGSVGRGRVVVEYRVFGCFVGDKIDRIFIWCDIMLKIIF